MLSPLQGQNLAHEANFFFNGNLKKFLSQLKVTMKDRPICTHNNLQRIFNL